MKCKVSFIYVYFNTPKELVASLKSIKPAIGKIKYEIIVVDNASAKPIPKISFENIKIIRNDFNFGFATGVNMGCSQAIGEFLLIINPDTILSKNSISALLSRIERDSKIGIIGPRMNDISGRFLKTFAGSPLLPNALFAFIFLGKIFPFNYFFEKYWLTKVDIGEEQEVSIIGGACFLIRKKLFDKLNGLDEQFFMYFEEADLCLRVKAMGKKILYYPNAQITHLVGRSDTNKVTIQKRYEKSRFLFLKKYHGLPLAFISEFILRMMRKENMLVLFVLLVSLFFNLYQINAWTLFIGDFGRDYLAARDMLLTGHIPLVGIPSSVQWLHQGPLSIYIIGLALFIGNFNPIAPAIVYGLMGVLATYFVYRLGRELFGNLTGILSALFFATSPLIVMSARMPYHTSSIPLFASIFFFLLYKIFKGKKYLIPICSFVLGSLLLLELSNAVLLLIVLVVIFIKVKKIKVKEAILPVATFLLGISPFIIYDLTHNFTQTIGFPLWIANRIRLFLGFAESTKITTSQLPEAVFRIVQQMAGIIFPSSLQVFVLLSLLLIASFLFYFKKHKLTKLTPLYFVLLWLLLPIAGFLVHAAPGTAYFPLLFPAVSLVIGYFFYKIIKINRFGIILFSLLVLVNGYNLISNRYYLSEPNSPKSLPPFSYIYGSTIQVQRQLVNEIVKKYNSQPINIEGGGFMGTLTTGIDNYKYLLWQQGGVIDSNSDILVKIYENKKQIPSDEEIFYDNGILYLTRLKAINWN